MSHLTTRKKSCKLSFPFRYGEPRYFTLGDKWFDPVDLDAFPHSRYTEYRAHVMFDDHDEWAGPKFYDEYLPKMVNDWFY